MKALSSNYQSREDAESIAKVESLLNNVVQMCIAREREVHAIIKGARSFARRPAAQPCTRMPLSRCYLPPPCRNGRPARRLLPCSCRRQRRRRCCRRHLCRPRSSAAGRPGPHANAATPSSLLSSLLPSTPKPPKAELTAAVKQVERDAAYPEDEHAHEARVRSLGADIDRSKGEIGQLRSASESAGAQHEALRERARSASAAHDAATAELAVLEPNKRHQLSLYAHISKMSWHFEKESTVAGIVSDPKTGDIRQFEFNPRTLSHFDIVNRLWDLV